MHLTPGIKLDQHMHHDLRELISCQYAHAKTGWVDIHSKEMQLQTQTPHTGPEPLSHLQASLLMQTRKLPMDWLAEVSVSGFRPVARRALKMQPMPVSNHQATLPDSACDPAQLLARQAQSHKRATEKFSPAASSFAASAANTAAAMSSTLREASDMLDKSKSQVISLLHACVYDLSCSQCCCMLCPSLSSADILNTMNCNAFV